MILLLKNKQKGDLNMLYILPDGTIRLTRGDTARFDISIDNDVTGLPYEIEETDVLEFSVKKSMADKNPLIYKRLIGTNMFTINSIDTKDLPFGEYVYDIQLTNEDGDVSTVITPSKFEIMGEVT